MRVVSTMFFTDIEVQPYYDSETETKYRITTVSKATAVSIILNKDELLELRNDINYVLDGK